MIVVIVHLQMALLDEDADGKIGTQEIRNFIDTPGAVLRQKLRGSLLADGWFSILFKRTTPNVRSITGSIEYPSPPCEPSVDMATCAIQ